MTGVPVQLPAGNGYHEVFRAFEDRHIRYTVLKGTPKLTEVLAGNGDLDLLVDPGDVADAVCLLLDTGFKPARDPLGDERPAQAHYFRPERSGGWAHVHLHSEVVCDEQLRTQLVLPSMTGPYLAGAQEVEGVRLPGAAAEYAHLLLKVFIRFGSLPDLVLAAAGRWKPWPEISAVRSRASVEEARAVLQEAGLDMPDELLHSCDRALAAGRFSVEAVRLGRRLRHRLSAQRVDSASGRWRDYLLLLLDRGRRTFGGRKRRVSRFGGVVVAVVGPDAVGKSTLVRGLADRFGAQFGVGVYHGGKPPPTGRTLPLRIARLVWHLLKVRRSETRGEGRVAASPPSLSRALNAWAIAEDRKATVMRAQRLASKGALVFFDRYPSQAPHGMDGPRLEMLRSAVSLTGLLSRREAELYRTMPPPDLVIRLDAPVSALVERDRVRKTPDGAAYLHQRSAPEAGWVMLGSYRVAEIATEEGAEGVRERAVAEVWSIF